MPTRMPKTFKQAPSSRVEVRAANQDYAGPGPGLGNPFSTAWQRNSTPLKTRVGQNCIWNLLLALLVFILALISDNQYGFSPRFKDPATGGSVLALMWSKAGLALFIGIWTFLLWWAGRILDYCAFNFLAICLIVDMIISIWGLVAIIAAQALDFNGTSLAYRSSLRNMLIFLTFVWVTISLINIAFTVGCIRYWQMERYQERHTGTATFATVTPGATAPAVVEMEEDPRPRAPKPTAPPMQALPAPGESGAQPVFYVSGGQQHAAPPVADAPVHDETTRALFAHLWKSMKEVGSFDCKVSRVPGLPELTTHVRRHGFLPLMTGEDGTTRKMYFYAEEMLAGNRVMVFLCEFKFGINDKTLSASFKCNDAAHMEYVKKFQLQEIFQVVA